MKNNTFHLSRTFFLEGPNDAKIFPHFKNITFSPEKRQSDLFLNVLKKCRETDNILFHNMSRSSHYPVPRGAHC